MYEVLGKNKKEIRVYVVSANVEYNGLGFRDHERVGDYNIIMTMAEDAGTVYTLEDFQEAFNNEEIDCCNSFIFISNIGQEV